MSRIHSNAYFTAQERKKLPQPQVAPQPEQLQRVSYFPPEDLWLEHFGVTAGWPEEADFWHHQRVVELTQGGYKPVTRSEWRSQLRANGKFKTHSLAIETLSEEVIMDGPTPAPPVSSSSTQSHSR